MLSVRGVGKYLKRWRFTPPKPIRKAYEQCPDAVKKWMDEAYPAIAGRAKTEGGEIHWGDETALVNTNVRGRSYAPKGKTPVTCAPGTRQKLSMISTVTNKGQARWMIIDGNRRLRGDKIRRGSADRVPRSADQGRGQENLSHPPQSARPSFQDREGLACRAVSGSRHRRAELRS